MPLAARASCTSTGMASTIAVYLRAKGLAVKTIRGYFSAIAFHSNAQDLAEFIGKFRLRRMLEGT